MQMPEKDMADFEKVVLAGMTIMFDEKTFAIFKNGFVRADRPVPQRLAAESAGLVKMLEDRTKEKQQKDGKPVTGIPKQIIAPAAAMLLMEMGKFMTEAGIEQVTSEHVREATSLLMNALKAMFAGGQGKPEQPAQNAAPPAPAPGGLMQQPQPQGV